MRSVRVDAEEVIDLFPPQIEADRILLPLPRLQGSGDTFKLLEVVFDVRVVRYGTEFQGWVFASDSASYTLRDHFGVQSLDGFGLKNRPAATGAAAAPSGAAALP